MSMTQSRGSHTALKWSTPALVVVEWLEGNREIKGSGIDGALFCIREFLDMALLGTRDPKDMGKDVTRAICDYAIASKVLEEINGRTPKLSTLRPTLQDYRKTVIDLQHGKKNFTEPDLKGLMIFLSVLHKQGEKARRDNHL